MMPGKRRLNTESVPGDHRDRGAILPIVLVVSIVLGAVVVAVASYTTTTLGYGQVVEARAGRLAAAQAGIDDALEQLSIRSSVCATAAGSGSGVNVPFPEEINGNSVTVNCRIAGGELPPSDGWALVITGLGAPNDGSPTFRFTLGGRPEIGGPVYIHDPGRAHFQHQTTIVEGDVWFPDAACAVTAHDQPGELQYQRSTRTIDNLGFDPSTRGLNCINRSWDGLFGGAPPVPARNGPTNPPHELVGSCRVFEPGTYTTAPALGNNNYFMSGNYFFDGVGHIALGGRTVTMGQSTAQGYPIIANTACNGVRTGAVEVPGMGFDSGDGATLYVSGNSRISVAQNSGFEIAGRRQGAGMVGMQDNGLTLGYSTPLLSSDNGARKEIAIQGLLWAPNSSLVFGTVPAQKAAALRGGAILARLDGGVSAAAIGFVIEVPTSTSNVKLVLESTATDNRGSNTVRVVADYRPSTGDVAVNSRRVLG